MPERMMQADDPAAIPQPGPGVREIQQVQAPDNEALRQIAGAVSALAGRMDRTEEAVRAGQRPRTTLAQRSAALAQAREFITELAAFPGIERVHAELAVARYLTGE
jgi:hypothetical protein